MNAHTELIPGMNVERLVKERDDCLAGMRQVANDLDRAYTEAEAIAEATRRVTGGDRFYMSGSRAGEDHGDRLFRNRFDAEKAVEAFRKQLDADIWTHLMRRMRLKELMDRKEREELERSLQADVPEITVDNVRATFQRLVGEADLIFQRGLARAFSDLDRRFRSHDAFKLGSRIILTYVFDEWGHMRWGGTRDTLYDVDRTFAVLDGRPERAGVSLMALEASRRSQKRGIMEPFQSETVTDYFTIRGFKNGNAHLWFRREDLVEKANKLLAEYYGEVLPDAAPKDDGAGLFSTSLVRDLQFYPTPEATVSDVLRDVFPPNGARVLEPSAGTGALVKGLLRKESVAHLTAIEVHPDRVARLRDIVDHRLEIREANFLQCAPSEEFDLLVMNPPFYGTHWMDHVRHAFAFLKPGGRLVSILPASAELKEDAKHLSFRRWAEQQARSWRRMWRDLPSESFAESGTRINTVLLDIERRATP